MVPTDADVIIAGAGPAGSIAAYTLASQGIRVLVLEKATFPRYKVCGGGLTYKITTEIPFSLAEIIETEIHTVSFSSNFQHVFSRTSAEPIIYCTMRSVLDQFLLDKAIQAGAKVMFNQQVTGIKNEQDSVSILTKEGRFRSEFVIGADGPASIVARSVGLRQFIGQGLAWEAEITTSPEILKMYSDTVFLDWGTFPGGYGWVFPKKDHFSIGVGGPASLSKQMMPYYHKFLDYLDFGIDQKSAAGSRQSEFRDQNSLSDRPFPLPPHQLGRGLEVGSLKSWPIPVRTRKGDFHADRVLVAGDAAGLTDSLTGEGIYYAIRSGKLAASACASAFHGKPGALKTYSDQVNDELMTELLEGNKIKHIFNTVPLKIHLFVRDSDRAWRAFGRVLRGERNYRDVKLGFGKWKILWNFAAFVSGFIESMKTSRYRDKQ